MGLLLFCALPCLKHVGKAEKGDPHLLLAGQGEGARVSSCSAGSRGIPAPPEAQHRHTSAALLIFTFQRRLPPSSGSPITRELRGRPPVPAVPAKPRLCLQFINYYHF